MSMASIVALFEGREAGRREAPRNALAALVQRPDRTSSGDQRSGSAFQPAAALQGLPPGGADVVCPPGVGFYQSAVPQVAVVRSSVELRGIAGAEAVAEEA